MQNMTKELTRMSYSRVNTWLMCPRKYAYSYVDKAPEENTPLALIFGVAIHEAFEALMKSIQAQDPITEAEVHGIFAARFDEELMLSKEMGVPVDYGKETETSTKVKGEAMLTVLLEKVDREITIFGTETEFNFFMPSGHSMMGCIDLIIQDSPTSYRVIDLKTAAKSYGPDKIAHDYQPTVYLEAARQMLGDEVSLNFEYWVLTKTKTPKFEIVPVHRDQRDWQEVQETVCEVQAGIDAQAYYRRRSWQCNGCQYAKRCGN